MVRMRAAFGVGVKADVLTFLLGGRGAAATVREVARATAYSERSARTACKEMALAGILSRIPGRPVGYRIEPDPWAAPLGLADPGATGSSRESTPESVYWRYWPQLFAFLLAVLEWQSAPRGAQVTDYVLSSQARDLYYQHQLAFVLNGILVPNPEQYVGEEYLDGFLLTLTLISQWLKTNV